MSTLLAIAFVSLAMNVHRVEAQGFSPAEAASKMTTAAGLEVRLFAAEPMVRQPVCIEFDDRGRLWVIQYLQYPNPAGLQRVEVDRYSRTKYDKIPKPPPYGPVGADRISILEDVDGDGQADSIKDFVGGLNLASGMAFGYGGVFVLNVPYLLFYPDENRDDVPDGDPHVLLSGFGMEDAHSVANSLAWGPDGWLYGCQGSTVTANIRGIEFQQGVWRYHPNTHEFELFCEGGGNSWGLDFDSTGQLLYSTNWGGKVMLHGVQGAYLIKSFGKHGALHNPFAFGYFDHVPHDGFRGGHVSVGGLFYNGTTFPANLHGKYLAGDLLGHGVYWHELHERGGTFASAYVGTLLAGNDSWFAPTDVTLGPDGAIYVTDWHDKRTAHPDPDADWDRTNGRIYRIQAKDAKAQAVVDVHKLSSQKLVELSLNAPDGWTRRRARRVLAEHLGSDVADSLRTIAINGADKRRALRATWALYTTGNWNDDLAEKLLKHRDRSVRAWAVRFSGDDGKVSQRIGEKLVDLARSEESARVQGQLACTARRLPLRNAVPILRELVARDLDASDPYNPLLIWWGLEQHATTDTLYFSEQILTPDILQTTLFRSFLAGRLMKRWAASPHEKEKLATAALLAEATDDQLRETLVVALVDGLSMLPTDRRPRQLTSSGARLLLELKKSEPWGTRLARISIRLGDGQILPRLIEHVSDKKSSDATRLAWLAVLHELRATKSIPVLLRLADDGETSEPIRRAAVSALGSFSDPRIHDQLLEGYSRMPPGVQAVTRGLFWSREQWAVDFLQHFDREGLPPKSIPVDELSAVAVHDAPEIKRLVRKQWGSVTVGTPGEKLAEVRRLNNDLNASLGRLEPGKAIYEKQCGKCHKLFDTGKTIGPELTHANRKDRQFLLRSLVDPSAQIRREFLTHVINTVDGRVLSGVIVAQDATSISLADNRGEVLTIKRSDIDEFQESTVSLMPEDLYRQLKPQDLRDLFRYLQQ